MEFIWFPYVQFTDGSYDCNRIEFRDKTTLLPDSDATWNNILKNPRPKWMEIYRDFPNFDSKEAGQPIRGTVLVSDRIEWLYDYIDSFCAILYFIGNCPLGICPAEKFYYRLVRATHKDSNRIGISGKASLGLEDVRSVFIPPPIELRAKLGWNYEVQLKKPENQTLLELFFDKPEDRLIVASRNYFRANFDNLFTSPRIDDCVKYCACLEALFDVSNFRGVGDQLADHIQEEYFENEIVKMFIVGLYAERSRWVHGSSDSSDSTRINAHELFKSIPGKVGLIREVCRDLLGRKLGKPSGLFPSEAGKELRSLAESEILWDEVKKKLLKNMAGKELALLAERKDEGLLSLASDTFAHMNPVFLREQPPIKTISKCITSLVVAIAKLSKKSSREYQIAEKLGEIADKQDEMGIITFFFEHHLYSEKISERNECEALLKLLISVCGLSTTLS